MDALAEWVDGFSDDELFEPGGRKWVHTNTVAPFKSFLSKIRKWKKLRS